MTNLEAKQEAIKKAYGEFWNRLSDSQKEYALNNNGNVQIGYNKEQSQLYKDMINSDLFLTQPMFPNSLQGIENNNGWIKIESKENLPKKEFNNMWIKHNDGDILIMQCSNTYLLKNCTHYQTIEKPKPPIY